MDVSDSEPTAETLDALAWFDYEPGPDDWVNGTWIGIRDQVELRIVDVVTAPGRHTLLVRMEPDTEGPSRWDDLDYDDLQSLLDEAKAIAAKHEIVLWAFAGPATRIRMPDEDSSLA